ncbi:MAG: DUF3846 domain-containing protein [Eubacteriales bacterium]
MKEYDITITETLQKTVTVTANSKEEAEDLVHDEWSMGVHILSADDFVDATIEMKEERENLLDVLLVEPMKPPKEFQVADTLEALQGMVNGYIETVNMNDDPVVLICNEEGKMNGSTLNRAIYDKQGEIVDVIAGSFLIVGSGDENFESLSQAMKEKYAKEFETPEKFFKLAGKVIAQKVTPTNEATKKAEQER